MVDPKVISDLINGKYNNEGPENSPVFDPELFDNIGEVFITFIMFYFPFCKKLIFPLINEGDPGCITRLFQNKPLL